MDYIRVHPSTLRPDVDLTFDVYIKLTNKYLLYVKKGDPLDIDRFRRLKDSNNAQMFIRAEDHSTYLDFKDQQLEKLRGDTLAPEKKSAILVGEAKAAAQGVYEEPEKKEYYIHTQDIISIKVKHLLTHPFALEQMLTIESFDKGLYQHCVNVATISIGLAASLGASDDICEVVGTGALLHDIADKRSGAELLLSVDNLSPEQKENYETHPRQGAGLLSNKKYISKDVLDVILLHHERLDGKGFPAGVKKLDQIFQVVGLANIYDRLVTFEGKDPQLAYDLIRKMDPAPYQEDLITGLETVLKSNKML